MKLNRTHGAVALAAIAAALATLLGTQATPVEVALDAPAATTAAPSSALTAPSLAAQIPSAQTPCDRLSPFSATNTACSTAAQAAPSGAAPGATEPSNVTSEIGPIPDFVKVEVVGSLGSGVAATLLKAAGRSLSGTRENHDAMLIDASTMADAEMTATVQDALSRGQYIILDGSDSVEGSTKVNQIMSDLNLMHMRGVIAYGLSRGSDGKLNVTPLQTVADEKGARQINQIHNVLNIKKT